MSAEVSTSRCGPTVPQGCFDAIAHAIDDPGTRAYEKALDDQMMRDAVMFGLSLINPFQRGFGLVAGTGRSVAVGEVTGFAREAGTAGVARAVTAGRPAPSARPSVRARAWPMAWLRPPPPW
jgi:hypothetical protein